MAIYEYKYTVELSDIGRSNKITNKSVLKILENAGGRQSEKIGLGINQVEKTGLSWVLLAWKVKIIRRPIYNEELTIKTWAQNINKISTYRDYEIYDEKENLLIIASSKWILINIYTGAIEKITDNIIKDYDPEDKHVFENKNIDKLVEPKEYEREIEYKVIKRDIDINNHVHNLYYLDFAYEALPEDVYRADECNNIEVMYKKQIKLADEIVCLYAKEENENIVSIKSKDKKILHAIVKLY